MANERLTNVQGWGVDKNPKDRPAYPKENFPENGTGAHWSRPEQQPKRIKVFISTERPEMTRVFGTSAPPSGLSGVLKGIAYKWSENDLRRWLLLLFSDRVNMVEGIFSDLSRGHIPNIPAEMGWNAEWKYNRKGAIKKIAIAAGVLGLVSFYFMNRSPRRLIADSDM